MSAHRRVVCGIVGAVALQFAVTPSARAAEIPPAPPAVSPQTRLPCGVSGDATPRRSALHFGTFDLHLSLAAGFGAPLHVGVALSLIQPLKHRDGAGEIGALASRSTRCSPERP